MFLVSTLKDNVFDYKRGDLSTFGPRQVESLEVPDDAGCARGRYHSRQFGGWLLLARSVFGEVVGDE